jgi:hypothetical protein
MSNQNYILPVLDYKLLQECFDDFYVVDGLGVAAWWWDSVEVGLETSPTFNFERSEVGSWGQWASIPLSFKEFRKGTYSSGVW